jgi:hypothetical protein
MSSSQGDIANLRGEDVDWENIPLASSAKRLVFLFSFTWAERALNLFKDFPVEGLLSLRLG